MWRCNLRNEASNTLSMWPVPVLVNTQWMTSIGYWVIALLSIVLVLENFKKDFYSDSVVDRCVDGLNLYRISMAP